MGTGYEAWAESFQFSQDLAALEATFERESALPPVVPPKDAPPDPVSASRLLELEQDNRRMATHIEHLLRKIDILETELQNRSLELENFDHVWGPLYRKRD